VRESEHLSKLEGRFLHALALRVIQGDEDAVAKMENLLYSQLPSIDSSNAATYLTFEWHLAKRGTCDSTPFPLNIARLGEYALYTVLGVAASCEDARIYASVLEIYANLDWQLSLTAAYYLYQIDKEREHFRERLAMLTKALQDGKASFPLEDEMPGPVYCGNEYALEELKAILAELDGETAFETQSLRRLKWKIESGRMFNS